MEKALSKDPFIQGRGYRAANSLIHSLSKGHFESEQDQKHVAVALKVLYDFFMANSDFNSSTYKSFQNLDLFTGSNDEIGGGVLRLDKDFFLSQINSDFSSLAKSRYSIRYFNGTPVSDELIMDAINISSKTPSVCNRQAWHVWHVKSEELVARFMKVHNGFSQEEQNLTNFLVVGMDRRYFSYPLERNQAYTDGGLYSMSLLYSLTSLGLATCPLNANLPLRVLKKLKKELDIPGEFTIVMFIAVGHYKDSNICPYSFRTNGNLKYTVK